MLNLSTISIRGWCRQ